MSISTKRDWREDYRILASMTEEDLKEAVDQLPQEIRDKLAEGPNPNRYSCGVCKAFGQDYINELTRTLETPPDPNDPKWRAFGYHEVPKKDMTTAQQQWSGSLAQQVYERTIATYKAAGWEEE